MSKYKVLHAKIVEHRKYDVRLHLTLLNMDGPLAEPLLQIITDTHIIDVFRSYNCKISDMPESYTITYIDTVRWKAPYRFRYKRLVRKGIYTVFDTIWLYCEYFLDENGNKVYCKNESPHEKGLRVLAECCTPVIQTPITEASQTTTNTNRTANQ